MLKNCIYICMSDLIDLAYLFFMKNKIINKGFGIQEIRCEAKRLIKIVCLKYIATSNILQKCDNNFPEFDLTRYFGHTGPQFYELG